MKFRERIKIILLAFVFLMATNSSIYAECLSSGAGCSPLEISSNWDSLNPKTSELFSRIESPTIEQFNSLPESEKSKFFSDPNNLNKCLDCANDYYGNPSNVGLNPQTDEKYFQEVGLSLNPNSANKFLQRKINNFEVNFKFSENMRYSSNPPSLVVGGNVLEFKTDSGEVLIPKGVETIYYDSNLEQFVFEPSFKIKSSNVKIISKGILLEKNAELYVNEEKIEVLGQTLLKKSEGNLEISGEFKGSYEGYEFESLGNSKLIFNLNKIEGKSVFLKSKNFKVSGDFLIKNNNKIIEVNLNSEKSIYKDSFGIMRGKANLKKINSNWDSVNVEKGSLEFGEELKSSNSRRYVVNEKSIVEFKNEEINKISLLNEKSYFIDKKKDILIGSINYQDLTSSVAGYLEFKRVSGFEILLKRTLKNYFSNKEIFFNERDFQRKGKKEGSKVLVLKNKIEAKGRGIKVSKNGENYLLLRDKTNFKLSFSPLYNKVFFSNSKEITSNDNEIFGIVQKLAYRLRVEENKLIREDKVKLNYLVSKDKSGEKIYLDTNSLLTYFPKLFDRKTYFQLVNDMQINLGSKNKLETNFNNMRFLGEFGSFSVLNEYQIKNIFGLVKKHKSESRARDDIKFISFKKSQSLLSDKEFRGWKEGLAQHRDKSISVEEFASKIRGHTSKVLWFTIDNYVEEYNKNHPNSKISIEDLRYVRHPTNPNVVIDMNHFIKIGLVSFFNEVPGDSIEFMQYVTEYRNSNDNWGEIDSLISAGNPQDYYSNRLGTCFYRKSYHIFSRKSFDEQIRDFFENGIQECENY